MVKMKGWADFLIKGVFLDLKVPLFKIWDSTFLVHFYLIHQNFSYRDHFLKFRWTFDNQGNFLIILMTLCKI